MSFFVVYKKQNLGSMRVCMFYFISFFNTLMADLYITTNFLFNHSLIIKIQTVRQWVACGGHFLTHVVSELLL